MPLLTGTHDITALLATRLPTTAAEVGMDNIAEILRNDIEAHNSVVRNAIQELADITTDRRRTSSGSSAGEMIKVDEYARAPSQRPGKVGVAEFPLDKFQYVVGWTREWEEERSPADFAEATQRAEIAHLLAILKEFKSSIFLSANYTFQDHMVDNVDLAVKRLLNADGWPIPYGPNGESFDGATHTHYLASATLTTAAVDSLISTVREHGHTQGVRIYINIANETAFKGLTGFYAYTDARLIMPTTTTTPRENIDLLRTDNRAIGVYGAAEVWTKPWVPANYAFCFAFGGPKPVVMRERRGGSGNLRIAATIDAHPLVAEYMEAKFGFGVWNRSNGAVLYFAGGAYVDPVIT